jgi:hypothetical protein
MRNPPQLHFSKSRHSPIFEIINDFAIFRRVSLFFVSCLRIPERQRARPCLEKAGIPGLCAGMKAVAWALLGAL